MLVKEELKKLGLHFIVDMGVADGIMIITMVGFGYRIMCGDLPGLAGEEQMGIMDGHLWDLV
jgi:hypothetical protein